MVNDDDANEGDDDDEESVKSVRDRSQSLPSPNMKHLRQFRLLKLRKHFTRLERSSLTKLLVKKKVSKSESKNNPAKTYPNK